MTSLATLVVTRSPSVPRPRPAPPAPAAPAPPATRPVALVPLVVVRPAPTSPGTRTSPGTPAEPVTVRTTAPTVPAEPETVRTAATAATAAPAPTAVPAPTPEPATVDTAAPPVPARTSRPSRRPRRSLEVPLAVLACLGAVAAVGVWRPAVDTATDTTVAGADAGDGSDPVPLKPPPPDAATVAVGVPLVPAAALPALVSSTASGGRTVSLTFDDGPDPTWTPQVLDLLAQYRVRATFCIIGEQADAHPDLVARIRAAGHLLCDHTQTHDAHLAHAPEARVRGEVLGARDRILEAAGPGAVIPYFRAPEGAWSPALLTAVADGGMTPLSWSVDTLDWTRPGVDPILATIRRELHPGGVILLHDGGGPRGETVTALRALLPWLQQEGWRVDVPEPTASPRNAALSP